MSVLTKLPRLIIVSLALSGACLVGCDRGDGIRVDTVPKDPPPPATPKATAGAKPVAWQLPSGWSEVADSSGSQFGRFATIQVNPADPSLALTVNVLQGSGSGELLPNLNRWEGTLGLPATPAAEAEKKAKTVEVDGHAGRRIDLTGVDVKTSAPARLLGFILPHGQEAWSFKLQGSPDKVAAQEAAFDAFIGSVKFLTHDHDGEGQGADEKGTTPPPSPAANAKPTTLASFTAPFGWRQEQSDKPFRVATFFVDEGNARAEVIVSKLRLNGFGSMLANVNRWRGEVGLPPSTDEKNESLQEVQVGGSPCIVFDFAGPESADAKRSNVAMLVKGADVWFVKLIGPAKTVADQRANFDAFLQSLQFGEAGE